MERFYYHLVPVSLPVNLYNLPAILKTKTSGFGHLKDRKTNPKTLYAFNLFFFFFPLSIASNICGCIRPLNQHADVAWFSVFLPFLK